MITRLQVQEVKVGQNNALLLPHFDLKLKKSAKNNHTIRVHGVFQANLCSDGGKGEQRGPLGSPSHLLFLNTYGEATSYHHFTSCVYDEDNCK